MPGPSDQSEHSERADDVRGVLEAVDLPVPAVALQGPPAEGAPAIELAALGRAQPLVAVFLRHFG